MHLMGQSVYMYIGINLGSFLTSAALYHIVNQPCKIWELKDCKQIVQAYLRNRENIAFALEREMFFG